MEKVVDLRKKAKRLGLKRFSRLRKQELIDRIRTATNILDEEIPETEAPILRLTRYEKPEITNDGAIERKKEIRELEEMLGLRGSRKKSVAPEIKITDPEEVEREIRINRIKEINGRRPRFITTTWASALRGFAKEFRIEGISGFGPREFMQMVKTEVLNLMKENPGPG